MVEENGYFRVDGLSSGKELDRYDSVRYAGQKGGRQGGRHRSKRRSGDYFATLAKRALVANNELTTKNLPYRFCVYQQGDQVLLDIVALDEKGNVIKTVRKNITEDDFDLLIDDMSLLEGLFLDTNA